MDSLQYDIAPSTQTVTTLVHEVNDLKKRLAKLEQTVPLFIKQELDKMRTSIHRQRMEDKGYGPSD